MHDPSDNLLLAAALHYHGGNFVVGSKALLGEPHVKKLLELGFVVVSANYRLCPTTTVYDGPVQDAFDAYNWARTILPDKLKADAGIEVDGTRIVTFGHSCGATLALLTVRTAAPVPPATTNRRRPPCPPPPPPLAILDLFGMKYLRDPAYSTPPATPSNGPPLDPAFTHKIFADIPPPSAGPSPVGPSGPDLSNYRVAWMLSQLRAGTLLATVVADGDYERVDPAGAFGRAAFPPTCFVHGAADALVDCRFSVRAHEALRAAGVETELVVVEGAAHGFDARAGPGDEEWGAVERGLEFLKAHV